MVFTPTALAVGGLLLAGGSAAAGGYQASRAHDQEVQGRHQAAQAAANQTALDNQLAAKQKALQQQQQQELLYQRQRAVAIASYGSTKDGTIKTTPFGAVGSVAPTVGGNSYLGSA